MLPAAVMERLVSKAFALVSAAADDVAAGRGTLLAEVDDDVPLAARDIAGAPVVRSGARLDTAAADREDDPERGPTIGRDGRAVLETIEIGEGFVVGCAGELCAGFKAKILSFSSSESGSRLGAEGDGQ